MNFDETFERMIPGQILEIPSAQVYDYVKAKYVTGYLDRVRPEHYDMMKLDLQKKYDMQISERGDLGTSKERFVFYMRDEHSVCLGEHEYVTNGGRGGVQVWESVGHRTVGHVKCRRCSRKMWFHFDEDRPRLLENALS